MQFSAQRYTYICLKHRYVVKRHPWANLPKCATCQERMLSMGDKFKPPPKENDAQWAKIELAIKTGVSYDNIPNLGEMKREVSSAQRLREHLEKVSKAMEPKKK